MTLEGTVPAPSFPLALGVAVFQVGILLYLWSTQTSAKVCIMDPLGCGQNLADADPWGRLVIVTQLFCAFMWVVSLMKRKEGLSDPSIVDRLWSILPMIYVWYVQLYSGSKSPRALAMAILVTCWGTRLTYNFAIKGGFTGGEDYRWAVIRKWFPGWKWEVFNAGFICFFQQNLILSFSAPAVVEACTSSVPLGYCDFAAAGLFGLLLAGESVADKQMFDFQTEKYRRIKSGEKLGDAYEKGFIDTGLWAYSRHPNYFCEVGMWWAIYLFTVETSGWLNWTIAGPVMLTILFVPPGASLDMTETLSSRKYAAYADYQQRVSRFVPWFPSEAKSKSL